MRRPRGAWPLGMPGLRQRRLDGMVLAHGPCIDATRRHVLIMSFSARFAVASGLSARPRRWLGTLLVLAVLLAGLGALLFSKSEHIVLGAEAYLYGFPLVIMDLTRVHASRTLGPENRLHHVRKFPDAGFKAVVRPNVDTLYTTSFIDMMQGPWVFEMAANHQRYELMPFMDAWTNVFAAPGTRNTGTAGGRFLLVGPHWQGTPPPGMTLLRAPTRLVWLVGRLQTNGVADYAQVHRLQDGLSLRRLADGPAPLPAEALASLAAKVAPVPLPPAQQMQAMATVDFFERLAMLMVDNPPSPLDGPMVLKLARIGLAPGKLPQWNLLERWSVALGRQLADFKVAQELKKPRDTVRGWSTPPAVLGQYGSHYNIRAVVAMIGLGANLPADATYPNTHVDAHGEPLNGRHRYRLHFKAGALPPVRAFWSITAYGPDEFLIDHPLHRYALGDRDPLVFNPDGSLDVWIQADPPAPERHNNWLPVKAGERFLLNARLYWPHDAALDGRWGMPAVERLD